MRTGTQLDCTACLFPPDGDVLATGDYSARVHLWDVRTGARAGGPLGAGSIVLSLAFSPDGRVLAAGTAHVGNQAIAMGTVPYEVWTEAAIAHLEVGDEVVVMAMATVQGGDQRAGRPGPCSNTQGTSGPTGRRPRSGGPRRRGACFAARPTG